jgi:SAM-dependent methyltransferase
MTFVTLEANLREMEWAADAYWKSYPGTTPIKLRWRALSVRHSFHVLPGESILVLGAGSGLWTQYLDEVLQHQNPITAVVFHKDFQESPLLQTDTVRSIFVEDLARDLPSETFDYVVGTGILCHDKYAENLRVVHRLLKPGGSFVFFEPNHWNPQVWLRDQFQWIGRWAGQSSCQTGIRRYRLLLTASHQGLTHLEAIPYDIVHPRIPARLVRFVQSLAFVFEHAPLVKEFCGTIYFCGRRPAQPEKRRAPMNLATRRHFFDAVSVVIPCFNEEMNIPNLVAQLIGFYGDYIHEIVIVNDNSRDRTAEVTREVAKREPRVKLVNRQPPNGVGLALRDGYAAATGKYILTMDCDFVDILPEFRDLFAALDDGYEGAIGSRFTHDSIMVNYPFLKIVANRSFHLLVRLVLRLGVRDISNNLKLYRADIFKTMKIEQPGFAANAETGLKAKLAGYRLKEVPISWINRTMDMGSSSFRIVKVAPGYAKALFGMIWRGLRQPRPLPIIRPEGPAPHET